MKKVVAILALMLVAVFNVNAQSNNVVKTVSLEETKGEFTQKALTLSEGTYVFNITNTDAAPEVGLVLVKDGVDASDANNHIKNAYVSKLVKHGKTESSKEVVLKKGTYKYFCPFNKTPQYTLTVE